MNVSPCRFAHLKLARRSSPRRVHGVFNLKSCRESCEEIHGQAAVLTAIRLRPNPPFFNCHSYYIPNHVLNLSIKLPLDMPNLFRLPACSPFRPPFPDYVNYHHHCVIRLHSTFDLSLPRDNNGSNLK